VLEQHMAGTGNPWVERCTHSFRVVAGRFRGMQSVKFVLPITQGVL
jgi:hypothetical protein